MKKASTISVPDIFLEINEKQKMDSVSNSKLVALGSNTEDINSLCEEKWPKTINDLNSGFLFEIYEFGKNDRAKLELLGFLNIDFDLVDKIVVIEYSQSGNIFCKNQILKFGIGARMIMKIRKKSFKFGAKLNSPQQITASVIFGKVDVSFSINTFGIVGPGIGELVKKAGSLQEDTYSNFLFEVGNLIVDAYKDKSKYRISPTPLFLSN